jgi:hypothetical protein
MINDWVEFDVDVDVDADIVELGVTGFFLGVLAGLSYCTFLFCALFVAFLSTETDVSYVHGIALVMVRMIPMLMLIYLATYDFFFDSSIDSVSFVYYICFGHCMYQYRCSGRHTLLCCVLSTSWNFS